MDRLRFGELKTIAEGIPLAGDGVNSHRSERKREFQLYEFAQWSFNSQQSRDSRLTYIHGMAG